MSDPAVTPVITPRAALKLVAGRLRALALAVLVLPFFAAGWLVAASLALVVFGARAGWIQMRELTQAPPESA